MSSAFSSCNAWRDSNESIDPKSKEICWVPLESYTALSLGFNIHSHLLPHHVNLLNTTFVNHRIRTNHLGNNNKEISAPRVEKGSNGNTRVTCKINVVGLNGTLHGVLAIIKIKV